MPAPLDILRQKAPIAADLSSAQWSEVALGLRDRAFFSAHVQDASFLAEARRQVELLAEAKTGRTEARDALKKFLGAYGDTSGDPTDLTDLTSDARLNLILDHNLAQAQGYGRFVREQNPDALDAFPAQELVRDWPSKVERDWPARWAAHGGTFYGGRMIALKDDPIWTAISTFGTPFPPFDFNSGMGLESIDRAEAESLGLLGPGDPVAPSDVGFNDTLQASIPHATPATMEGFKAIFGDDIAVGEGGKVQWTGDRLADLYKKALSTNQFTPHDVHNVGLATDTTTTVARRDLGVDLDGWSMEVRALELRHSEGNHGTPGSIPGKSGETDSTQQPITEAEVRAIPQVWRAPDQVKWGKQVARLTDAPPPGWDSSSIQFLREMNGVVYLGDYVADASAKILRLGSMWKKLPVK